MTAKEIIIDELENGIHPEKVEDVIFWALEYYCTHRRKGTWGETIAYAIKQRILDEEDNPFRDLPKQDVKNN